MHARGARDAVSAVPDGTRGGSGGERAGWGRAEADGRLDDTGYEAGPRRGGGKGRLDELVDERDLAVRQVGIPDLLAQAALLAEVVVRVAHRSETGAQE